MFGNNLNKSKFYSGRDEQIECLLSFSAESFAFKFAMQKYEDYDIQKYNFAFFLYEWETWSLTLIEECRLSVFENGAE